MVILTSTLLVSACWIAAGPQPELSGIFVNQQDPLWRIELLKNGRFYLTDNPAKPAGTFTCKGNTIACRRENGTVLRFRLEGESLVDSDGVRWLRREQVATMPWKPEEMSPVRLVILDSESRRPITPFAYTYRIIAGDATYDPLLVRPIDVVSEDGSFTLTAPTTCRIVLYLWCEDMLRGFGHSYSVDLTRDNQVRVVEVEVATGVTVEGRVVDAKWSKPIGGARVSPIVFTPPLFTPDHERSVKTDGQGRFTIHGVDPELGIHVRHIDYLEFGRRGFEEIGKKVGDKRYSLTVRLRSGHRLGGTVRDPSGKPLAGVLVSDGAGKQVRTDRDGKFVLNSPYESRLTNSCTLMFTKDGYLEEEREMPAESREILAVVLRPIPLLTGRVVDSRGNPVSEFEVAAGMGNEPGEWACTSKSVRCTDGTFSLPVRTDHDYDDTGRIWIGVRAPGFALADTVIAAGDISKPLTMRLGRGVAVHGRIECADQHRHKVAATLTPLRMRQDGDLILGHSQRVLMGTTKAMVSPSGSFELNHIVPGPYRLRIGGPKVTPVTRFIYVSQRDVEIEPLPLAGRGTIEGVVYEPEMAKGSDGTRLADNRDPWRYATGTISPVGSAGLWRDAEEGIDFRADDQGRFRADNVPVGRVHVNIPYHITADIIGSYQREAVVLEGRTTQVRFFDITDEWETAFRFQIGDGSPDHFSSGSGFGARRKVQRVTNRELEFRIELQPLDRQPISFEVADREPLNSNREVVLRDVHPGRYRVKVYDWLSSQGLETVIYETIIVAKPGRTLWTVRLGAGSITGVVRKAEGNRLGTRVVGIDRRTGVVREAYCDSQGAFCLRFLPPGKYQLWARDDSRGWCSIRTVTVDERTYDVGVHSLSQGGSIEVAIPRRWQYDPTLRLTARHANGVTIGYFSEKEHLEQKCRLRHLWPGRWTVRVQRGDQVVEERTVTLSGRQTVVCSLDDP